MEYTVAQSDSIERIAAMHDCTVGELMKMNRLATRMVFPGQKLLVPCPLGENGEFSVISENRLSTSQAAIAAKKGNGIRRGPGMAVQIRGHSGARSELSTTTLEKHGLSQMFSKEAKLGEEVDTDNMKKFIKLKVKQITEMNGTVTGTLLVTPNALMFDPDVVHPLVLENGQDVYIMMARMEEVISVTMFKSATILSDGKDGKEVNDFTQQVSSVLQCSPVSMTKETANKTSRDLADDLCKNINTGNQSPRVFLDDMYLELKRKGGQEARIGCAGGFKSRLFTKNVNKSDKFARVGRRASSDLSNGLRSEEISRAYIPGNGESKQQYTYQSSATVNNANSLSKLGRTLSARASTVRDSLTFGAERVTQSAVNSTKSVAQGVISQSKAVAGTLQTGIQTSIKVAASHAKSAVNAVTAMPQGIASVGSGLFYASHYPEVMYLEPSKSRKEQNLATLLSLKEKTGHLREEAMKNKHSFCTTSMDEMLHSFKSVHESSLAQKVEKNTLVDSPYFMAVRLHRKKKCDKGLLAVDSVIRSSSASTEDINHARQEFWFAIPKHKIDAIYCFLLQWGLEKYGSTTQKLHPRESFDRQKAGELLEDNEFVVLNSEDSEKFAVEVPSSQVFGSSYLNREWEIVTVQEMCRRMSLDQLDKVILPLPDGAASSQILDEFMIRQMVDVLPARAAGYPWVNIYNSEKHGFSLHTFYRKMMDWDEEMSPILLIIRDCEKNVFGAVVSTTVRPCEHFFGTGDSCFLYKYVDELNEKVLRIYRWSGINQLFVKASMDSLSIGASGGHYGLWLDADLDHGRTQACETFQNEPLAGENEDFIVQFVEAYGFRLD